jgi:hypothetical protein
MTVKGRKDLCQTNTLAHFSGASLVKQISFIVIGIKSFFFGINEEVKIGRVLVLIQYSKLV